MVKFRYFGEFTAILAHPSESRGVKTQGCFQIAAEINFRYGRSEFEYIDNFALAVVQAYVAMCALSLLLKPWKVGDPICGISERTAEDHLTSHLGGWGLFGFKIWRSIT